MKFDSNFGVALENEIYNVAFNFMVNTLGFSEDDASDYLYVEVSHVPLGFEIEVRAELTYRSMTDLAATLNPILEQYDSRAYFDHEAPGIMNARIYPEYAGKVNSCDEVPPYTQKTLNNYVKPTRKRRYFAEDQIDPTARQEIFESKQIDEYIDYIEPEIDQRITVYDDGGWDIAKYEDDLKNWGQVDFEGLNFDYDAGVIGEDALEFIEDSNVIPTEPGEYRLTGWITLVYNVSDSYIELDEDESDTNNLKIERI